MLRIKLLIQNMHLDFVALDFNLSFLNIMTLDEEWQIYQLTYSLAYYWAVKTLLEKD